MRSSKWSLFKCQRCGQCCEKSGLPWDPWKSEEIAKFLKMDFEDFFTRYYGKTVMKKGKKYFQLNPNRTTHCPFLGKDKSCHIYPVRPYSCEHYPVDTDFGRCGVDCPAMKIVNAAVSSSEKEEDPLLDTTYLLFENPEEKGILHPPFGYICVGSYSRPTFFGHEHIGLTAECNSVTEVEWWVKSLKGYLDKCLEDFKRELAQAKKKSAF